MPSVRSMMSLRMLAGMSLLPIDAVDHGVDIALRQPIDGEDGHVRPSDPGRLEFRPEGHDQQHGKGSNPVHRPTKRFQARGVGPMRILEDHQHRILPRQRFHLGSERFQRSLSPLLWGQIERGIASVVRQRQHFGKERGILDGVEVCASTASSLSSFVAACRRAQTQRHVPSG